MPDAADVFSLELGLMSKHTIRCGLMERPASTTDFTLGAEAKLNVTSGLIWIYAEVPGGVEGTVDSATSSTVKDASFTEADNRWQYMMLRFTSNTQMEDMEWLVSSFSSDGTFALDVAGMPLPVTPVAGDTFILKGRALLGPTAMTISNGEAYYQIGPTNGVTTTKGRKIAKVKLAYTNSSGDADEGVATWVIDVHD